MNKKKVFIWSLYDFANSFVSITFFLYFSQWLVVDRGISDFWFNATFVLSSALLLLTAPIGGSISDKIKIKLPGLRICTVLSAFFFFITGLITVLIPAQVVLAIITFTFATYFYLFSFTFYNAFLEDISTEANRGIVSGWGIFGNYLGQICGILVALPFATGKITLFGQMGRAQAFIPASILFFVFSLPMLLYFKDGSEKAPQAIRIRSEYRNMWRSFKLLCASAGLGYFFLAYFFFNDAVVTASNNFPIFLEKVFATNDIVKSLLLIGILITSAVGAPLSGFIADRVGLKKTLMYILLCWVVVFPALAFVTYFPLFVAITIAMGLLFGSVWAVTRATVTAYTPKAMLNQSFSYYTLMERFATFIGPVSWGLIVTLAPHRNAFNYRAAAFAMGVFVLVGLLIAKKIPARPQAEA